MAGAPPAIVSLAGPGSVADHFNHMRQLGDGAAHFRGVLHLDNAMRNNFV